MNVRTPAHLGAFVLVLLAAASCTGHRTGTFTALPQGSYAGSTAAQQPVQIDISGNTVKLNNHRAKRRLDGSYVANGVTFTCRAVAHDAELTCQMNFGTGPQAVELMHL